MSPKSRKRNIASVATALVLSAIAVGTAAQPLTGASTDPTKASSVPVAPVQGTAASELNVQSTTPPSNVTPIDAAIAEQLRNFANGKFDAIVGRLDRANIGLFYSGRGYAPVWFNDGRLNSRAKAAIAYLGQVDADGLDPADYPVPNVDALSDPAMLAEAEIRLTTSVLSYAHHAQAGRVHWTRVSGDIWYDRKPLEPADVLATVATSTDVGQSLAALQPQGPAYLALKAKLAELRAAKDAAGKALIGNGPMVKVGGQDERVPQLRSRLEVPGHAASTTYDKALAEAVKKFQQQHGLQPTGLLSPATVKALNGPELENRIDIIIANMERWRWIPRDLGNTHVIVNIPDFTLRVMHERKTVWMTKVVDGKPATPTPIMSADMKSITVNPTWNIPPSIAANEYLPLLRQDPTILTRMGLNVSRNPDGTIHLSQPPGDNNALGRLRFNFPNKFLVYQHDSNERHLFTNPMRAASHGCMRVQDPVKYAEVLLGLARPREGYTQDRIRRMFGNSQIDIQLPSFIPVHLTYQTAFIDEDGVVQYRDDVYGRDRALVAILKGSDRKIADIAIERKENFVRREALAIPDQAWAWVGGQSLFGQLFGYPGASGRERSSRRPVAERNTRNTDKIE